MRTVIVVSRCLDERAERLNFHFKGYLAGEYIKTLQLKGRANISWQKGEEYVLYVKVESVRSGILCGEVIRSRALDELTD